MAEKDEIAVCQGCWVELRAMVLGELPEPDTDNPYTMVNSKDLAQVRQFATEIRPHHAHTVYGSGSAELKL
jgi:hypothetical protein